MTIFNFMIESKIKYDSKIIDRAYNVFNKLQNILKNSNNYLFTLYPIRKDKITFRKNDKDICAFYMIGKTSSNKDYADDIRKIITDARYTINDITRDCKVTLYNQTDNNIYSTITFFNSASKYILSESFDDEEETERTNKFIKHLNNSEIRRCKDIIKSCINKFPKIKKCCDYIDLYDTEEFDDDGKRSSALSRYQSKKGSSYLRLVDGDVYSGYPDFKEEGSEEYRDDINDLKEEVDERFKLLNIPAEFVVKFEDDSINFGIVSNKT